MSTDDAKGKVLTVLGPIDPYDLGVTQTHEHLISDLSSHFVQPEDELGRVFDVGFRGDPARTPGEGTGLGLAIAHELVKAHRGEISVSNENGGARFTLRLPVDDAISAIAARSRP